MEMSRIIYSRFQLPVSDIKAFSFGNLGVYLSVFSVTLLAVFFSNLALKGLRFRFQFSTCRFKLQFSAFSHG